MRSLAIFVFVAISNFASVFVYGQNTLQFRLCGDDQFTHPELKATWIPHSSDIFKSTLKYSFAHTFNDHLHYVDKLHFVARDEFGNTMTNQMYSICGPGLLSHCFV